MSEIGSMGPNPGDTIFALCERGWPLLRSPWCVSLGLRRAMRARGTRRAACPSRRHATLRDHRSAALVAASTAAWCCGSRRRQASPARTWQSSSPWRPRGDRRTDRGACCHFRVLRLAEPGRFARRAFENGKLDLPGRGPGRPDQCRDAMPAPSRPCASRRASPARVTRRGAQSLSARPGARRGRARLRRRRRCRSRHGTQGARPSSTGC